MVFKSIKKGQVSLEFFAMMAFAGVALMIFIGIAYNVFHGKTEESMEYLVIDFGSSIQNEIILASEVSPGYTRKIIIPDKIGRLPYDLYLSSSYLIINYSRGDVGFKLPPTTGSIGKGVVTIQNVGGVVVVS